MQTSFPAKSYTNRTCITFGGKPAKLQISLNSICSPPVARGRHVFQKGKLQQHLFSKYTWKMAFVLPRIRSGTLRALCEPKDVLVGYSCDLSKNSPNPRFWYNTYRTLYHVV